MPIPPPPPRQLVLSILIEKLHLKGTVPQWVGLVVLAVLVPSGVWMGLGDSRSLPPLAPVPAPVPQVPLQASTWAPFPPIHVIAGALPDGIDTQRKPPCDPDAEEAIGGWCWIPLNVEKCPEAKGKAFSHKGKCYIRALRAERTPTSGGDSGNASVAAPQQ